MARLTKRVGENITYNQERKIECSVYCDECFQGTANCKTVREMVKKLADYEDAEEQRLLLRLPCKVGDIIYYISEGFIEPCTVEVIFLADYTDKNGNCSYMAEIHFDREDCPYVSTEIYFTELGKTVFFTKEEAERILKRMESEVSDDVCEWKQEDDNLITSCGDYFNILDNCTEKFDFCPKYGKKIKVVE